MYVTVCDAAPILDALSLISAAAAAAAAAAAVVVGRAGVAIPGKDSTTTLPLVPCVFWRRAPFVDRVQAVV